MKKKIIKILSNKLESKITNYCLKYTTLNNAKIISKIIVRAEKMEILTHGLHYFLHSIAPHLKNGISKHHIVKKKKFSLFSRKKWWWIRSFKYI